MKDKVQKTPENILIVLLEICMGCMGSAVRFRLAPLILQLYKFFFDYFSTEKISNKILQLNLNNNYLHMK